MLPELGRAGAKVRERTRPERLKQDWREFLLWWHANVGDEGVEKLFFRPTAQPIPLADLTVKGDHRAQGHDYKPTPKLVFDWALAGVPEDFSKLSFVDYGAGRGRVLLLAAQHPFAAVGGIEFATELHDDATMNIAQFPRSSMKCRNVECVLEDAATIGPLPGEAIHYFFNAFSAEIFAEVLAGIVASYREHPRRLYLILDRSGGGRACRGERRVQARRAARCRAPAGQTVQPLRDRDLPLARLTQSRGASVSLHAELLLQARRGGGVLEDELLVGIDIVDGGLRHQRGLVEAATG